MSRVLAPLLLCLVGGCFEEASPALTDGPGTTDDARVGADGLDVPCPSGELCGLPAFLDGAPYEERDSGNGTCVTSYAAARLSIAMRCADPDGDWCAVGTAVDYTLGPGPVHVRVARAPVEGVAYVGLFKPGGDSVLFLADEELGARVDRSGETSYHSVPFDESVSRVGFRRDDSGAIEWLAGGPAAGAPLTHFETVADATFDGHLGFEVGLICRNDAGGNRMISAELDLVNGR